MLVYANHFSLKPNGGARSVIEQVAAWIEGKEESQINVGLLANGIREFRMKKGGTLSSAVTPSENGMHEFPYYFCVRYQHADPAVNGRRWITEVGLRQFKEDDPIHCSILNQTEEISARVTTPIEASRPRIVKNIIDNCSPTDRFPSQSIITLTEDNAAAFAYEIEHSNRSYPLVLVSAQANGLPKANLERLRNQLIGLAQVVAIPENADTFEIEARIGRRYSAFGGAINIIFPYQKTDSGGFCATIRLLLGQLENIEASGTRVEAEVLSIVSHRTNVPNSWKHISSELVKQEILRSNLRKAAEAVRVGGDTSVYESLLNEAAESLSSKDKAIQELHEALELSNANLGQKIAESESLKFALSSASSTVGLDTDALADSIAPLRNLFLVALNGEPSLEQALLLATKLFPERLVVLESAFSSARESDRGGFLRGAKALDLMAVSQRLV